MTGIQLALHRKMGAGWLALVVALIRNIDIIVAFISWSRDGPNENEQVGAFAEQSFRSDWI